MVDFWKVGVVGRDGFPRRLRALPAWARILLAIAALPGLALLALSMLGIVVSLLALLLLTAPVYVLVKRATGMGGGGGSPANTERADVGPSPAVKRVEATVVDS